MWNSPVEDCHAACPFGLVLVLLAFVTPGVVAAEGKRYAVLIGIQKYDDSKLKGLEFAERDMTDLGKVLEAAGYNVTILTDSTAEKDKSLVPTKSNIEKSLKAVLDKVQKDDLVLVAFSGHGVKLGDIPKPYLCPKDANPLPDEANTLLSIESLSTKLRNAAGAKIILIDACRNAPKSADAREMDEEKLELLISGTLTIVSCSTGEHSIEDKSANRGVFFNQVIEGLKGKSADGNDAITFTSLARFVKKEVPKEAARIDKNAKQTPWIHEGVAGSKSPTLAMRPEAIADAEWKEYESVWSNGSTEPFLKKNAAKRYANWRKSADAGSARGMMLVADCAEFGVGDSKDPKDAARWYGKGANAGNTFAMVGYAMCYERGFGVEKNNKEAAVWLRKSADLGDAGGIHGLGSCYATGRGVEKDAKEAVRLYLKSAEMGFGQAMTSLGLAYLDGDGVEKDEKEAAKWFRKGAEKGTGRCMLHLGLCYHRSGMGVTRGSR